MQNKDDDRCTFDALHSNKCAHTTHTQSLGLQGLVCLGQGAHNKKRDGEDRRNKEQREEEEENGGRMQKEQARNQSIKIRSCLPVSVPSFSHVFPFCSLQQEKVFSQHISQLI
mmetsp:Transcript_568/g.1260  ORF Transcript_568/g.1260 Transcript_568/m.1260 type:complete len:113 (-) Transcript_568:2058-2396(-)